MRNKPMISMADPTGVLEVIKSAGGSPDELLDSVGQDGAIFSKPARGFIAVSIFAQILEDAARATGDDLIASAYTLANVVTRRIMDR